MYPFIPLQKYKYDRYCCAFFKISAKLGDNSIPVYLYENSAKTGAQNLSFIRKGEYEAIPKNAVARMETRFWTITFVPSFGMMALGARNFLIAYNINLTTKDEQIAKQITKQIRAIRNKTKRYLSSLFQNVKTIRWYGGI